MKIVKYVVSVVIIFGMFTYFFNTLSNLIVKARMEAGLAQDELSGKIDLISTKEDQLESRIVQLEKKTHTTPPTIVDINDNVDLSGLVNYWKPHLLLIGCQYDATSNEFGSALITKTSDGTVYGFTNAHVVTAANGKKSSSCAFQGTGFPSTESITPNMITFSPSGKDVAYINFSSLKNVSSEAVNTCKDTAPIGEKILIIGYPMNGSTQGVTVTDGIISGYDGYFYVTSAKIDHGNSGGVAIDIKNNCYLGIPSWVETSANSFESYGRILEAKYVFN